MRKGFARDETDAALAQARELSWIGDRTFAKLWVEDRLLHHPLSRRAIEEELRGRKVARDVAAAALDEGYPKERERDIALGLAESRCARLVGLDEATCARRTTDFLIRRGFTAAIAAECARRAARRTARGETDDR